MARGTIRACVDRVLPPEVLELAHVRAVAENKANESPTVAMLGTLFAQPSSDLPTGRMWRNGRTLRVGFLDGDAAVHAAVASIAPMWSEYANIRFAFSDGPRAEIRISFVQEGSWSYIGTDALMIPEHEPTMNLGWLQANSPFEELTRVVLHEFGHAIGCVHEHQNPVSNVPWNKEAVYRYYMGPPNNWSKADIDRYVFQLYAQPMTNFTEFDAQSIMLYPIPHELTIGDFEVGWNTRLSRTDKAEIGRIYPWE